MSPGHWQRLKLLMRLLIQMIDDRGQMLDVRCQRTDVRCQRTDVRCQRTEVGSRTRRRLTGRDYAAAKDGEVGKLRKGQRAQHIA